MNSTASFYQVYMVAVGGGASGGSGASEGLTLEFIVAVGGEASGCSRASGGSGASEGLTVDHLGVIHSSPVGRGDKFDVLS